MKTALILLGLATCPVYADSQNQTEKTDLKPYRQSLREARAQYRESVRLYGPNSPQSLHARSQLRASRHAFHAQRRAERMH